jgi:transposase-like protein
MPTFMLDPISGRYLSFEEREEIALLKAQGAGIREIARRLGRSPSTISRELRRNAATRGGKLEYRASVAQWKAELMARRPKTAKLAANERLREYVQERLSGQVRRPNGMRVPGPATRPWKGRNKPHRQDRRWARAWSPEQISARLRLDFPHDESMRISHEAIYQSLYVQGRGALRRELTVCLRTGRALRVPRARTRGRRKSFVSKEILISERPAEAEGSRRPWALGGRPHPWLEPLSDRHAGGAQHTLHDAAAPTADGRPRRAESKEGSSACRAWRGGRTRRDIRLDHEPA